MDVEFYFITFSIEWGNDLPLDDMNVLPYHRIPEAMHAFVEKAKRVEFYEFDERKLQEAQDRVSLTLQGLARMAHNSSHTQVKVEEMARQETQDLKKRGRESDEKTDPSKRPKENDECD